MRQPVKGPCKPRKHPMCAKSSLSFLGRDGLIILNDRLILPRERVDRLKSLCGRLDDETSLVTISKIDAN